MPDAVKDIAKTVFASSLSISAINGAFIALVVNLRELGRINGYSTEIMGALRCVAYLLLAALVVSFLSCGITASMLIGTLGYPYSLIVVPLLIVLLLVLVAACYLCIRIQR